jgi:hypothetical protein
MTHKFQNKLKKYEIFTTSTYSILASIIKISAQNFTFLIPNQRCQRLMKSMLTFLRHVCAYELGELMAWLVVGKKELRLALGK